MLGRLAGLLRCPRAGPALLLLLHLAALGLFTRGFLLTRVHLPQRSAAHADGSPAAAAPYDRVVWLMIDALRYDFVVADGRYRCSNATGAVCHQGHMPHLSALARHPVGGWAWPWSFAAGVVLACLFDSKCDCACWQWRVKPCLHPSTLAACNSPNPHPSLNAGIARLHVCG